MYNLARLHCIALHYITFMTVHLHVELAYFSLIHTLPNMIKTKKDILVTISKTVMISNGNNLKPCLKVKNLVCELNSGIRPIERANS